MKDWALSLIRNFNIRHDHNKWTIEYLDDNETIYFGWMMGNESDIEHLRKLGVIGPMTLTTSSKGDAISHCVITREVAEKLRDYDGFASSYWSFTGVNKYGKEMAWGIDDFEDLKED